MALTVDDYEELLDSLATALECLTSDRPWPLITEELRRHLHGTAAVVLEVNWAEDRVHAYAWAPPDCGRYAITHKPGYATGGDIGPCDTLLSHPLLRHYAKNCDLTPRTNNDLLDGTGQLVTEAQHPLFRALGLQTSIAVPLAITGEILRTIVVARLNKGFTTAECAFVRRLQPLLIAFDRQQHNSFVPLGSASSTSGSRISVRAPGLTPRETAVLGLLAEAHTAKSIARRLGLSERTVTKHLEHLYRKLDTCDRLGTVLRAQSLGLLPPPHSG